MSLLLASSVTVLASMLVTYFVKRGSAPHAVSWICLPLATLPISIGVFLSTRALIAGFRGLTTGASVEGAYAGLSRSNEMSTASFLAATVLLTVLAVLALLAFRSAPKATQGASGPRVIVPIAVAVLVFAGVVAVGALSLRSVLVPLVVFTSSSDVVDESLPMVYATSVTVAVEEARLGELAQSIGRLLANTAFTGLVLMGLGLSAFVLSLVSAGIDFPRGVGVLGIAAVSMTTLVAGAQAYRRSRLQVEIAEIQVRMFGDGEGAPSNR